jgi:arsenate reductase
MAVVFYHNPRCVTSKKALDLLRKKGIEPDVVEYLKTPPSKAELKKIADLIGVHPRELLRKREKAALAKAGIDPKTASATDALDAMAREPVLIERPIIVNGRKARLGRPPESVLEAV